MPNLFVALLLTLSAGVAGLLLAEIRNRDLNRVRAAMRQHVRTFLDARAPRQVHEIIREAGIQETTTGQAQTLLLILGEVLEVDFRLLRADDRLDHLLKVPAGLAEAGARMSHGQRRRDRPLDFFSLDLVERLALASDKRAWELARASLPHPPTSEESWADLLSTMTIREFLCFFAPTVRLR